MAVVDSRACPPVEAGGRTDARSLRSAASHAGGREPRFVVAGWRVRSAAPKAAAAPTDATLASSNRRATGRGDLSWPAMTPCTISSVEHAARCSKPAARSVGEDAPRTHEQHLSSRPTPCAGSRPLGGSVSSLSPSRVTRDLIRLLGCHPCMNQFASRFLHRRPAYPQVLAGRPPSAHAIHTPMLNGWTGRQSDRASVHGSGDPRLVHRRRAGRGVSSNACG